MKSLVLFVCACMTFTSAASFGAGLDTYISMLNGDSGITAATSFENRVLEASGNIAELQDILKEVLLEGNTCIKYLDRSACNKIQEKLTDFVVASQPNSNSEVERLDDIAVSARKEITQHF